MQSLHHSQPRSKSNIVRGSFYLFFPPHPFLLFLSYYGCHLSIGIWRRFFLPFPAPFPFTKFPSQETSFTYDSFSSCFKNLIENHHKQWFISPFPALFYLFGLSHSNFLTTYLPCWLFFSSLVRMNLSSTRSRNSVCSLLYPNI